MNIAWREADTAEHAPACGQILLPSHILAIRSMKNKTVMMMKPML